MYIMLHIVCKMQVDLVTWKSKLNLFLSFLTWERKEIDEKSDVSTWVGGWVGGM